MNFSGTVLEWRHNQGRRKRGIARRRAGRPQRRPARAENNRSLLDQAIAINGELRVQLFGLNLLPVQVRLLVSSKEVAAALGLDWWRADRKPNSRRAGTKR